MIPQQEGAEGMETAAARSASSRTPNDKLSSNSKHTTVAVQQLENLGNKVASLTKDLKASLKVENGNGDNLMGELVAQIHNVLDQCLEIKPMTFDLLQNSKIGKRVAKVSNILGNARNPQNLQSSSEGVLHVVKRAHAIILFWNYKLNCRGTGLQRLLQYRKRKLELEQKGQAKPDMVTYKEMRLKYGLTRPPHGVIPDVPVGIIVQGRGEAAVLGLHCSILTGIDAIKGEGQSCFAVCLSGKYNDRHDDRDGDGIIEYTGMGGMDPSGKSHIKDQEETPANASLIRSQSTGDPIRVLRRIGATGFEYRYEGSYRCIRYTFAPNDPNRPASPKVYRFTLQPMEYESTYFIRKYLKNPNQ